MNRLRDLRQGMNWTQTQLGQKIGAAKSTISGYEAETHQLDAPTIHRVCDLFGCTADYLLGRSNAPLPAVSDADARILDAYHAASLRDRALVDQILAAYMEDDQGKSAPSSAS